MAAIPDPESVAERLTLTPAAYQPLEHAELLQAIEDVGGVESAGGGGAACTAPPMTSFTVFTTVPLALLGASQERNASSVAALVDQVLHALQM